MGDTSETRGRHSECAGDRCPECGTDHIDGDRLERDGDTVTQGVECAKCGSHWTDVFRMSGVRGGGGPARIEMWPVFDCGSFKLEDGRLRRRAGMGGQGVVDAGPARNAHLRGFLASAGDGTVLGRLTVDGLAAALGFGLNGWEADVRWAVQLTEEEWEAARRTEMLRP